MPYNNIFYICNTFWSTNSVKVAEKLLQNGVGTHIRVTIPGDGSFTDGYTSSGNTMNPNRFFYSDIRKNVVLNSSGEVEINKQVVAQNSTEIVWGWGFQIDTLYYPLCRHSK